jgi:hypothetical protein
MSPEHDMPGKKKFLLTGEVYTALKVSIVLQLLGLLFSGMILDGGILMRIFIWAIAGYWGGALLILFRRRSNPTSFDLAYLKYGAPINLAVIVAVGFLIPFVAYLFNL